MEFDCCLAPQNVVTHLLMQLWDCLTQTFEGILSADVLIMFNVNYIVLAEEMVIDTKTNISIQKSAEQRC